jgi:hypothetical protein
MKRILLAVAAALLCLGAAADEGMWMINAINRALELQMQERGLQLSAGEIYNADVPGAGIADAVVSMDFGCTGSIISDRGLLITNHHCAYADVHALSDGEHNYLQDGFWALDSSQEVPIKGKKVQFLKRVIDVTDEALQLIEEQHINTRGMGLRKLSFLLEKKYSEETGLEASLSSMWSGSKYYIALYEEYSDVRLVAAPPVSIAAFGGDVDNWEWPQHKCDFALYRVYAAPDGKPADYSEANVPLKPLRHLAVSRAGYGEGDFAMIIGYPGRTDRYSSAAKVAYQKDAILPISTEIRGAQMDIISRWMDADPAIRLKYANRFFGLSNFQELQAGEVLCYNRFDVVGEKRTQEKELLEWIDADPERKTQWDSLLSDLDESYAAITPVEKSLTCYRETMIRGTQYHTVAARIRSLANSKTPEARAQSLKSVRPAVARTLEETDPRVEKELWRYAIEQFYEGVDSSFWQPFEKEVHDVYGSDYDALCENIWSRSWMTDPERMQAFLDSDMDLSIAGQDSLFRLLSEIKVLNYNQTVDRVSGDKPVGLLGREYTHALYQMREDKGRVQYPDANSTMRLTYGVVGGYEPRDGIWCDWKSSPQGLVAKHNPAVYDFCLKEDWKALLEREQPQMPIDFLTDNDITGGNSGSPVMNARGELIGLAFDGNKESLASDASYTPQYNKCVCADIRFALWVLERYAGMGYLLEELDLH